MTDINLANAWEAVADVVPEREAVVCEGQRLTYAELEERSNRLAHWFLAQGVQPLAVERGLHQPALPPPQRTLAHEQAVRNGLLEEAVDHGGLAVVGVVVREDPLDVVGVVDQERRLGPRPIAGHIPCPPGQGQEAAEGIPRGAAR